MRVEKSDSCWIWQGSKTTLGYGQITFQGKTTYAHRCSWELSFGEIPRGGVIDHLCHNPSCVNPGHMRIASHTQNIENRKGANKNSASGVRGVYWRERHRKWFAQIKHDGKTIHVGQFSTIKEAERAVIAARKSLFSVTK